MVVISMILDVQGLLAVGLFRGKRTQENDLFGKRISI